MAPPYLYIGQTVAIFLLCGLTLFTTFGPWFRLLARVENLRFRISLISNHSDLDWPASLDTPAVESPSEKPPTVDLVVASTTKDNTSWIWDVVPAWNKKIYVVDDPNATLTVPQNKGNEAMVYLTYLIDQYSALPDVIIFQHASRYQWHNDDPLYDGARVMERLKLKYVQKKGYVNLRCNWTSGCPETFRPLDVANSSAESGDVNAHWKEIFEFMFRDEEEVPEAVGAGCCAQFATSREQVLARPRETYERIRQWIFDTEMRNGASGRVFERIWHLLFGAPALDCPVAKQCYCDTFGLCDLECENDGQCASHYTTPPPWKLDLPDTWPELDRDGKPQDLSNNETITRRRQRIRRELGFWDGYPSDGVGKAFVA